MIAYIKGKLAAIQEDAVIVDVNGIGYEIICANPFVFQSSMDESILIYTYHHVREDIQQLYGFKHEDDKYLFTKLISVSGIGPKSAIAILGTANVSEFVSAVEMEDEKYLTQFPGVGKKTARQIILDLKGKLTAQFTVEKPASSDKITNLEQIAEAKEALKVLGYSERELNAVLPQLQNENVRGTDAIIRKALSLLAK